MHKVEDLVKCKRLIRWLGKVEEIILESHTFAWSGNIPCTGIRKCIYCGLPESEVKKIKNL